MRNKRGLNNVLNTDRKTLYIILSIVMVSVLTLTVVYAALSTTLNITGNAEVTAANWDIHLDNVVLNNSSATTTAPTITDKTTASFSTTLSKPGDFYEFTIDVVNNGSIDAMIDSVTKTPELTDAQKKYLNYIVEYQNGEAITTKQLVVKKSFVRLKVKVEFRKDLTASDLPSTTETLNLLFKVNYVQADATGSAVKDDGVYNPYKVGNEICLDSECFYVISSDEESVTMLAKYNLYVGGKYENSSWTAYGNEATGIQDSTMVGYKSSGQPWIGTTAFSSTNYWYSGSALKSEYGTSYPAYVYDSNSILYNYVESYRTYLESQGAEIEEARLIKDEELTALGCSGSSCKSAPSWVYGTSYWSGSASIGDGVIAVRSYGGFASSDYDNDSGSGVRPVIKLSLSEF